MIIFVFFPASVEAFLIKWESDEIENVNRVGYIIFLIIALSKYPTDIGNKDFLS